MLRKILMLFIADAIRRRGANRRVGYVAPGHRATRRGGFFKSVLMAFVLSRVQRWLMGSGRRRH